MFTRRQFLTTGAAVAGTAATLANAKPGQTRPTYTQQEKSYHDSLPDYAGLSPGQPGQDYNPVITPNNVSLPWKIVDGVKVYHLVAEPVEHEFAPGLKAKCWGYNGRVHGPTIEAVEGDRTVGPFVIHPRNPGRPRPDRDFVFMLHEWRIDVGASRPNPNEMTDFNIFTFNARAFPGTEPMVARLGERVRIRLVNLGAMSHHPIHLHGYQFPIIETDGGQIPESAQQLEASVLTAVGQSRAIEFIANAPGDWAMHCHMTHHVMNQMGHEFPNLIGMNPRDLDQQVGSLIPGYMTMGTDGMGEHGLHVQSGHAPVPPNSIPMVGGPGPFDYITMGGLFTIFKVREKLTSYDDPGWYEYPEGTVAGRASDSELQRDGIRVTDAGAAPEGQNRSGIEDDA